MVKNHMKRITAPKTWNVLRKTTKFITRPKPGVHKKEEATSINTLLKEELKITRTTKETKYVLTKQGLLINGKRKRDEKSQAGLLDHITLTSLNKNYIITVNKNGSLKAKEITEEQADKVLLIIKNKTIQKKALVQLNTNILNILLTDKEAKKYGVGDSIIYSLKNKKILEHIPRKEGQTAFIFKGKHASKNGSITKIEDKHIIIKTDKEEIRTSKDYAFPINKDKLSEL